MAERTTLHQAERAVLEIKDLHVYYGQSHALQGVNLSLHSGVHGVVGRNGMGKTTLCNAIMGIRPVKRGTIRFEGQNMTGKAPHEIASRGIAYCPQGRRLWPSLSVDEHLRLASREDGNWSITRVYETFPRLYERRHNGGGQLSGGEQQMLAISRALLQDPRLLILDEPTEGLAPVIVDHVCTVLREVASQGDVAILLIEQNIAVATGIADDISIMVNGRITRIMPASELAGDRSLQERLLGVGRHAHDDQVIDEQDSRPEAHAVAEPRERVTDDASDISNSANVTLISDHLLETDADAGTTLQTYEPPTRWSKAHWQDARSVGAPVESYRPFDTAVQPLFNPEDSVAIGAKAGDVLVAGTFDTKGTELRFIRDNLISRGLSVRTVDLSTSGKASSADVPPHILAAYHPQGSNAVFGNDRGKSIKTMSEAFTRWIEKHPSVGGVISAGGSGATALATPAMQALPIGVPKLMISTVASGEVGQYVGASDIMMMQRFPVSWAI